MDLINYRGVTCLRQERADHNYLTDRGANALLFNVTNQEGETKCLVRVAAEILRRRKSMTRLTAPQSTVYLLFFIRGVFHRASNQASSTRAYPDSVKFSRPT
jgi:hypothetical protein